MKAEPVSSTNEEEPHEEKPSIDERTSNVIVKQQPPANDDDFENDPEAGPSGLQRELFTNGGNDGLPVRRYMNDSSDDDSGDEREMVPAMWRPQASYRFARIDDDSGDTRFSSNSWRFDQTAMNEPHSLSDVTASSTTNNNQADEVIDLSESESLPSNVAVQKPPTNVPNRSHEVLTAPDLQLDWFSDSSSDNEIVSAIRSRTLERPENLSKARPNRGASYAPAAHTFPAIDLTASDDEDTSFSIQNAHSNDGVNTSPRMMTYRGLLSRNMMRCIGDHRR